MKDSETLHCIVCNCCVEKWDHHCHWLDRCVNDYNVRLFNFMNYCVVIEILINWVLALEGFIIFAFDRVSNVTYQQVLKISNPSAKRTMNILQSVFFAFILFSLSFMFGTFSYIVCINQCHRAKESSKKNDKEHLLD